MVATLERIVTRLWAFHFRIGPIAWLATTLLLLVAAVLAPTGEIRFAALVLAIVTSAGVLRWHQARRRCRGAILVVPALYEGGDAKGRAEEAQRIVLDTLRRHLPVDLHEAVQPLPVVVGPDEQAFAERTRRRLGAFFVLHGRVAARQGGGWSVFPRLLEPAISSTTHIDWFTHDRTPANPRFGPFVGNLTPQLGVLDEEFPLDFCRDLEALVRGVVGRIAAVAGDDRRAVGLLDQALEVAGDSINPQIDGLRSARALALSGLGEIDRAIDSLRTRAAGESPSPALLRELAALLLRRSNERAAIGVMPEAYEKAELIRVLRAARAVETDPQRDQSTYNLFAILDFAAADEEERDEASALLDELLGSRTGYGRQWYLRRAAGVRAWRRLQQAYVAGNNAAVREAGAEAGNWYSRAIRARPRVQFNFVGLHPHFLRWHLIPPSPILYANAHDGHRQGGHRIRARWCEWRFQRIRRRFMKRGWKLMEAQEWERAYAWYDWVSIVGRSDWKEAWALAYASICLWKAGRRQEGELAWEQAKRKGGPLTLLARAGAVSFFERWGIDSSVPGDEPTDQASVEQMIEALLDSDDRPSRDVGARRT